MSIKNVSNYNPTDQKIINLIAKIEDKIASIKKVQSIYLKKERKNDGMLSLDLSCISCFENFENSDIFISKMYYHSIENILQILSSLEQLKKTGRKFIENRDLNISFTINEWIEIYQEAYEMALVVKELKKLENNKKELLRLLSPEYYIINQIQQIEKELL